MSLETLLEAAKYLDYRSEAKARGEEPHDYHTFAKLYSDNLSYSKPSPKSTTSTPTTTTTTITTTTTTVKVEPAGPTVVNLADESREKRRSASSLLSREPTIITQEVQGAGTREVHNKLEKNRRAHLKECFETLKKQLPNMDDRKTSNLSILRGALRYIQTLKRKEREYEHDMERLAREKIAFQQRLSCLKKELSSQLDHLDVNSLLVDGDNETTTTASECGPLSDDEEDDLPHEMSSTSNHNTFLSSSEVTSPTSSTASSATTGSTFAILPNVSVAVSTPSVTSSVSQPEQQIMVAALDRVFTSAACATTPVSQSPVASSSGTSSVDGSPPSTSLVIPRLPITLTTTVTAASPRSTTAVRPPSPSLSQTTQVASAGSLHVNTMAGILTAPHSVQVITQPSGIKVITPSSLPETTTVVTQPPSANSHHTPIHILTPTTTSLVAMVTTTTSASSLSTSVATNSSKTAVTHSLVRVGSGSAVQSSKHLVSPVTLVAPQGVGVSQVANATKPLIINQASSLAGLATSSTITAPTVSVALSSGKSQAAPAVMTTGSSPSLLTATSRNSLQNSNTISSVSSPDSQSNIITTLQTSRSVPHIIQPTASRTISSSQVLATGVAASQMNNVGRHIVTAAIKPVMPTNQVRSPIPQISGVAHVTHVMSQAPVATPVGQLVSAGSHVSAVTPLVAPVSVVPHATAVHHSQVLAQPQQIGKVLASPILKSVNQINQIPIFQQQFLQPTVGSVTAQPVVKPMVVVSMPNIVPATNVAPPLSVVPSTNGQQGTVRGSISQRQ